MRCCPVWPPAHNSQEDEAARACPEREQHGHPCQTGQLYQENGSGNKHINHPKKLDQQRLLDRPASFLIQLSAGHQASLVAAFWVHPQSHQ